MRSRDTRESTKRGEVSRFLQCGAMAMFGSVYGGLSLAQKTDSRIGLCED